MIYPNKYGPHKKESSVGRRSDRKKTRTQKENTQNEKKKSWMENSC